MKKIRVALGRTINMGQYESLRVDIDMEEEIGNASESQEYDRIFKSVKFELDKRIAELTTKPEEPKVAKSRSSRFRHPVSDTPVVGE